LQKCSAQDIRSWVKQKAKVKKGSQGLEAILAGVVELLPNVRKKKGKMFHKWKRGHPLLNGETFEKKTGAGGDERRVYGLLSPLLAGESSLKGETDRC